MAQKIKLLLADDHALVREGIRSSLVRYPSIYVVGEAATGEEAVRKTVQLTPDVVLMDLNMPDMSGLEATPVIRSRCPSTRVIALTVHDNEEYVHQILKRGASGYVLKDTSPEELVRAIESVAQGDAFFSPRVSRILLQNLVQPTSPALPGSQNGLSGREREVLQAIARGDTSKEIASRLKLSVRTVETYRVRIKRKLRARNTAELLGHAREQALL
jgi:two-component system nitrate/nitrite response regulator NarL